MPILTHFNLKREFNTKIEYLSYLKRQPSFIVNKYNLVKYKVCKNDHRQI